VNDEDRKLRRCADAIDKAFNTNPRLPALTDEQVSKLMVDSVACLAYRTGKPPSYIIEPLTDEGWPEGLVKS